MNIVISVCLFVCLFVWMSDHNSETLDRFAKVMIMELGKNSGIFLAWFGYSKLSGSTFINR